MEDLNDYGDGELIEELSMAAWAAVMHQGSLRTKAWKRFGALALVLQSRYPPGESPQPGPSIQAMDRQ